MQCHDRLCHVILTASFAAAMGFGAGWTSSAILIQRMFIAIKP